jgi:hypothetical protein
MNDMERKIRSSILVVLFTTLFPLAITPVYILVFAQLPIQPRQHMLANVSPLCAQSERLAQNVHSLNSKGVTAEGTINDVLYVPKPKGAFYVARGDFFLNHDGSNAELSVRMEWVPSSANGSLTAHTHAIENFRLFPARNTAINANNVVLEGCATVFTKGVPIWDIPVSVKIVGKTIDISFTGNDPVSLSARDHFGNQDTIGVVDTLALCSNVPLPNMEVLPFCSSPSDTSGTDTQNFPDINSNSKLLPFLQ